MKTPKDRQPPLNNLNQYQEKLEKIIKPHSMQSTDNENKAKSWRKKITLDQGCHIDEFYLRLEAIYGKRFTTQFSSEEILESSKLEFGSMILSQTKEKINNRLGYLKRRRQTDHNLEWPDIAYILTMAIGKSPDGSNADAYRTHKPLIRITDKTAIEKNQKAGKDAFEEIRKSLGIKTKD